MDFLKYIAKTGRNNQHPLGEKGTKILLEKIPENVEKILEIGCGTGHTAAIISNNKNVTYFGLDASKEMIDTARKRKSFVGLQNATFRVGKAENLPFENNFFDVVFCESVLAIQGFDAFVKIIKESCRVLKKEGVLLLNESLWKGGTSQKIISEINNKTLATFNLVQAGYLNNKKTWSEAFLKCSFTIEEFEIVSNFSSKVQLEKNPIYRNSKAFSKKIKLLSFLNPLNTYRYFYFKLLAKRYKSLGKHIESYLIVCKKL